MARNRVPARALITLGSALLILSGCDRIASHGDSDFARAALERNPDLTVVASDKDANTFTVQVKGSPELRVIRADEVIGTLPSTGVAPASSETAKAQLLRLKPLPLRRARSLHTKRRWLASPRRLPHGPAPR